MNGDLKGLPGVSAQTLSDVIGAIYDCALDPQAWPSTCKRIADLCDSACGGICVHDVRQVRNDQLFVFGYQPDFLEKLGSQYSESPMAVADVVAHIGQVSALSMDQFLLSESRFYREVMEPFGLKDIIWFPALRTAGRMASMHTSRIDKATKYQEFDIGLFKLLAPHVCRSLAISDVLDIRALQSGILEKTLDGLVTGVFLTTRDGHVVYMNPAAERQIRAGTSIRLLNNRLSPVDSSARTALSAAIAKSVREESAQDMRELSVAIPDGINGGYVATLLPVESGRRSGILAPFAASVAVFMQDPVEAPLMPGEAFARLYGLTGAELRVLLALAQGLGGMEAADMLGVSEPTVRTHLQRMYAKTRTAKQTDLLGLLRNSPPPVLQRRGQASRN